MRRIESMSPHDATTVAVANVSRWGPWEKKLDDRSPQRLAPQAGRKSSRIGSFPFLKRTGSGCTNQHGRKHGWKPATTGKRVLVPYAISSLVLAAIVEYLAQRSQKNGGLALSPSADSIPSLVKFSYLFVPTIIAVFYSIAWNWIDLDVKRIQPWLALSRSEGATAEESLLLDYPYDFVAFVPFKAAKRRHWSVLISGTTMVLIFWALTPLQSAIFGSGEVTVVVPANFTSTSALLPADQQAEQLDPLLLNTAFAIKYIAQPYPAFTTAEYALGSVAVRSTAVTFADAQNWTFPTTKYFADLECRPAQVELSAFPNSWHFVDPRGGCNSSSHALSVPEEHPYKMVYMGYFPDAHAIDFISQPTCRGLDNNFIAALVGRNAEDPSKPGRLTALFCETSYWKQNVTVSVSLPRGDRGGGGTLVPDSDSIVARGEPEPLPVGEFNHTGLEYLMGSGVSAVLKDRNHPATLLQSHENRLNGTGLNMPVLPMVGFAVADSGHEITDFFNETLLADVYRRVHKSMFALAFNRLQTTNPSLSVAARSDDDDQEVVVEGNQTFKLHGVVVSRAISAIVEGLLVVVALAAIVLHILCRRAESNLTYDPVSLGDVIGIVQNSEQLVKYFSGTDSLDDKQLADSFMNSRVMFHLECSCQSASGVMSISASTPERGELLGIPVSAGPTVTNGSRGHYRPVRPFALRREPGSAFILFLTGMLVGLVYLRVKEQQLGGLTRPTKNFEVLQLLENYIPTILATVIEPYWVLVNRLLCIMQPFRDLLTGDSAAGSSIEARYTSVPPQLVLWRAIRSGHILLSLVCVIALLSNVLTVGLGGLFDEQPVQVATNVSLANTVLGSFTEETIQSYRESEVGPNFYADHFLAIVANLTKGVPFPPWTTSDYYFLPFAATTTDDDEDVNARGATIIMGRTRGYGIDVACEALDPIQRPLSVSLVDFKARHSIPESSGCNDTFEIGQQSLFVNKQEWDSPSAIEIQSESGCDDIWVSAYCRASSGKAPNVTIDATVIACSPKFRTAMFDVAVDPDGYVQSQTRATDFENDLKYENFTVHFHQIISQLRLSWSDGGLWHNDTITRNWMDDLIRTVLNTTSFIDPLTPPPDPGLIIPPTSMLSRQYFALILAFNSYLFPPLSSNSSSSSSSFSAAAAVAPFQGTFLSVETRIFMSDAAFSTSAAVLGLNVAMAFVVFGWWGGSGGGNSRSPLSSVVRSPFLPRLPTTVGSLLAYMAPSRMLRGYQPGLCRADTFSFGHYVGVEDGRGHIGIELSRFVVPLDLKALKKGDTAAIKRTSKRDGRGPGPVFGPTGDGVWSRKETDNGGPWL